MKHERGHTGMMRGTAMIELALALVVTCTAGACDARDGRQGPGSAPQRLVPAIAQPPADARPGPRRVVQISAGFAHTCALFEDGGVRCWGKDANGRLGAGPALRAPRWEEGVREGRRIAATIPDVALGGRAVQIAAGSEHTCALLDTGKVRCWGAGASGQLGHGFFPHDIGASQEPALAGDVPLDEPVTQVVAGASYTCALLASGRVRCWGAHAQGALGLGPGRGNLGDDEGPTAASALALGGRVTQLSADRGSPCALLADGSVRCWGLVPGSPADPSAPAAAQPLVALGAPAARIASGPAAVHTCAITAAGRLRCWGEGKYGQLGHVSGTGDAGEVGVAPGPLPTPAMLGDVPLGDGRVIGVAPGSSHTCALLDTGKVRCWGESRYGVLGPGRPARVPARDAIEIEMGGRVVEIASGAEYACALLDTGRVRCWGSNSEGQLGYGMRENVGEKRAPAAVGDVPL